MKEFICKEVPTKHGAYITIEKEVIRCKDCKYHCADGYCPVGMYPSHDDDFCAWAEKKEEPEA